jgi:serralysin
VPHTITLNGSRLDFTSVSGFDIPSSVVVAASGSAAAHFGLAALTVAGLTGLYAVNLTTGAAVDLGAIGTGGGLAGLALGAPPAVRAGTGGNDSFVAFGGTERIDALTGIDTVTFGFSLTDATVTYAGNEVIIDTATSHTVLTGFEKYIFNDGTVDNNDGDALVDDLFYYAQYHDVWNAHVEADLHYHVVGWTENRDPSAFFDTSLYRQAHPDAAAVDPLVHFDTIGWKEGRMPSLAFGTREYLLANPDVAAAKIDPLAHFLSIGASEGRQPIAPSKFIGANGFDYVYYLNTYADVKAAGVDPLLHFLTIGWTEGRNPNALFDTNGYLATYTDVAAANINPLVHYNAVGWKEGRDPSVGFDTTSYLAAYTDVAAANVNPLMHFLHAGLDEGRSPFADGVWG